LLPATLQEGRTIVRNLRRAAKLFLLKNVYTLLLILAGMGILGLPFPYLPQQVTLLNSLTIGLPAFLIMLSRRGDVPGRAGFLREVGWFVLSTGLVIGVAGLVVFVLAGVFWPGTVPDRDTVPLEGVASGLAAVATLAYDHVTLQRTLLLATLILLGLV